MLSGEMEFEWDENKRLANVEKHDIDFIDARTIWDRPVLDPATQRIVGGEVRPTAIGTIGEDEMIIAVVYTARPATLRLISARRAKRYERKAYQDRFHRGS
jgi:uncharacterized DUF497 family protein